MRFGSRLERAEYLQVADHDPFDIIQLQLLLKEAGGDRRTLLAITQKQHRDQTGNDQGDQQRIVASPRLRLRFVFGANFVRQDGFPWTAFPKRAYSGPLMIRFRSPWLVAATGARQRATVELILVDQYFSWRSKTARAQTLRCHKLASDREDSRGRLTR